jgi:hypothetical protein
MDFYLIEEIDLLVGWNPKCACTSVCDWIVHGILRPAHDPVSRTREYLQNRGYQLEAEAAAQRMAQGGLRLACFVRNPLTRLVSGFVDKFVCRRGKPLLYPDDFEPLALQTIQELYAAQGYQGGYRGVAFRDLLAYIGSSLELGQRLDHHWTPQTAGLPPPIKAAVEAHQCFIVKQESFAHDLANLSYLLGLSYRPRRFNAVRRPAGWRYADAGEDHADTRSQVFIEAGLLPSHKNLLVPTIREEIAGIYRDDFELFCYSSGGKRSGDRQPSLQAFPQALPRGPRSSTQA